jgi:rhodanese-related sulfurtransferase/DNA-binding MarR family transcriptional regulator
MDPSTHRTFKNSLYEQFARLAKALANPHRLELVDLLAQGERTVEELAREAGMSIANTSQHLQALKEARLVDVRRDGTYMHYHLADESVFKAWQALRVLGESRLAEIEQVVRTYLEERDSMQPVSLDDLQALMQDKHVLLLDVRPEVEYRHGHIPGARSIPVAQLEAFLDQLPKRKEIVAYCRGPYCVFADEAVELLQAKGFRARRMELGFPDWQAAGLPVESD